MLAVSVDDEVVVDLSAVWHPSGTAEIREYSAAVKDEVSGYADLVDGRLAFRCDGQAVVSVFLSIDPLECVDTDGDGYGAPPGETCPFPEPDCDDSNPLVNPGAEESRAAGNCGDGIDNDCDALADTDPECQGGCFAGASLVPGPRPTQGAAPSIIFTSTIREDAK